MDETTYSSEKMVDELIDKKLHDYTGKKLQNNFVIPNELTVTITLSEYRELVEIAAIKNDAVAKANNKLYDAEKKIEVLQKERAELMDRIVSMQKTNEDE